MTVEDSDELMMGNDDDNNFILSSKFTQLSSDNLGLSWTDIDCQRVPNSSLEKHPKIKVI